MTPKFENSMLRRRRENNWNEICIVPHAICKFRCGFCFLNKQAVGEPDWNQLFRNVATFCDSYDFSSGYTTIRIFGGEIFMDSLVECPNYRDNLTKLFSMASYYTRRNGCLEIPVSVENVGSLGVRYIKELLSKFDRMKIVVPFSLERIATEEARTEYWTTLKALSPVSRVSILITGTNNNYREFILELEKYGKLTFEEPAMLDNFHFSYENMYLPDIEFSGVRCVSNHLRFITPLGIFTCAGMTKKPIWISDEEWTKLETDFEYLDRGYEQVVEWYGCNTCDLQETCPGMCWQTYYAQRYIYNNRKCYYKKK